MDSIKHHLYACHIENEELQRHLMFRDALKADPELCQEYARLKVDIALEAKQNRKRYAEIKEVKARNFIDKVLGK